MNRKAKALIAALVAATVIGAVGVTSAGAKKYYETARGEDAFVETLTVKQGSRGDTVKQIQQKLKRWGYYSGSVDGIFGSGTKKAVIYFQQKNGLTADGIVGAKTLAALGISAGGTTTTSSSYTSSDTNLLARLIYERGNLFGQGRGRRGRSQQGKKPVVPEYHIGCNLSAVCVHLRVRRTDQFKPRRVCVVRSERRDERLGSGLRQSLLLQSVRRDE